MNAMTVCGNYEALVAYLYDECAPAEREAIAAHVAICASCREEIGALRDTRAHLASWTPPALPLGFQITRAESEAPATVLRPAAWWRQPLPAWAQVAAAAVIFAAGMSVNSLRSAPGAPSVASTRDGSVVTRQLSTADVSREALADLDARLMNIERAQARATSVRFPAAADAVRAPRTAGVAIEQDELFALVQALVDRRMADNQEQNVRLIRTAAENVMDETTEQIRLVRQDQQELRDGIHTMAQSPIMKIALQASPR